MPRAAKKYEPGKGGKQLNIPLEEEDFKNLEKIKTFLTEKHKKLGDKRSATDVGATSYSYSLVVDMIEKGQLT